MPRNQKTNEFEAGALRTITYKKEKYFVDGRLKQVRNIEDFMDVLDVEDDAIFDALSREDRDTVVGEFYGYN